MSGHRKWSEIRGPLSPEQRARVDTIKQQMLEQLELHQLREMADVSQVEMARRMKTAQGAISRLERRQDVKLSTLREYVRAIGGKLEIRAVFKDRDIVLSHVGAGRREREKVAAGAQKKDRRSRRA